MWPKSGKKNTVCCPLKSWFLEHMNILFVCCFLWFRQEQVSFPCNNCTWSEIQWHDLIIEINESKQVELWIAAIIQSNWQMYSLALGNSWFLHYLWKWTLRAATSSDCEMIFLLNYEPLSSLSVLIWLRPNESKPTLSLSPVPATTASPSRPIW